jgi:hypothetical protein
VPRGGDHVNQRPARHTIAGEAPSLDDLAGQWHNKR